MLNTRNQQTSWIERIWIWLQSNESLIHKVYELDLSKTMKIHLIFHVFKLNFVFIDLFIFKTNSIKSAVNWGQRRHRIRGKKILDSKRIQEKWVQYPMKWIDYNAFTWESSENLNNCNDLLWMFHRLYFMKSTSLTSLHETW